MQRTCITTRMCTCMFAYRAYVRAHITMPCHTMPCHKPILIHRRRVRLQGSCLLEARVTVRRKTPASMHFRTRAHTPHTPACPAPDQRIMHMCIYRHTCVHMLAYADAHMHARTCVYSLGHACVGACVPRLVLRCHVLQIGVPQRHACTQFVQHAQAPKFH